jgi:hypothetical protein
MLGLLDKVDTVRSKPAERRPNRPESASALVITGAILTVLCNAVCNKQACADWTLIFGPCRELQGASVKGLPDNEVTYAVGPHTSPDMHLSEIN